MNFIMFSNVLISASGFPYFIFYPLVFLSMIFFGEEALLIIGALSRFGFLDFWTAFFIAFSGVFVGDFFWFRVGQRYGEKFILRHGRWFFITPERFKKIEEAIKKRGGFFLFFSKFMYNLNHISLVAAGAVKFDFRKFIRFQVLVSLIWTISFLALGYFFAHNLAMIKHDVKLLAIGLITVFAVFLLVDKIIEKIIERRVINQKIL